MKTKIINGNPHTGETQAEKERRIAAAFGIKEETDDNSISERLGMVISALENGGGVGHEIIRLREILNDIKQS